MAIFIAFLIEYFHIILEIGTSHPCTSREFFFTNEFFSILHAGIPIPQFYLRNSTSGFMAYFRFRFVLFFKNHRSDQFSQTNSSKLSIKSRNYFKLKKFDFGVKLQIWGHLGSNYECHYKGVNCISK